MGGHRLALPLHALQGRRARHPTAPVQPWACFAAPTSLSSPTTSAAWATPAHSLPFLSPHASNDLASFFCVCVHADRTAKAAKAAQAQ